MPIAPGTILGPYQIDAPLGAGGMGEVYKATDTRLDRTVAIKVLPEHVAADPDLKQRFEREARTVAALNHPHICTLHDIGSQDGIDFLVMEYLDGETLAQRLEKGALPLDQALTIAIEIADALDKAHPFFWYVPTSSVDAMTCPSIAFSNSALVGRRRCGSSTSSAYSLWKYRCRPIGGQGPP